MISGDRIEIAPHVIPIELIPSFNQASHKIFMSATLVDDAALIRDFAADPDSIQKPIRPKLVGDIGERLIISPSLVDALIDEITTTQLVSTMREHHNANVVVLVPSSTRGKYWENEDSLQVPGTDISKVIERLSDSRANTAILANRYDGIDLPNEMCRLLVLDELPQEHNVGKLTEAVSRQQSPILNHRIAQRIEQGMGRVVRSRVDYRVVLLTGKKLVSFMSQVDNQTSFTQETKRQIEIGKKLTRGIKEASGNAYESIMKLAAQCLNRDPSWLSYYRDQMQIPEAGASQYRTIEARLASAELAAWRYARIGQYDNAAALLHN